MAKWLHPILSLPPAAGRRRMEGWCLTCEAIVEIAVPTTSANTSESSTDFQRHLEDDPLTRAAVAVEVWLAESK